MLPPKSPEMNGRVERMQATWRNGFYNVQDAAANVTELNPMIDRYLRTCNSWRPPGLSRLKTFLLDFLLDSVLPHDFLLKNNRLRQCDAGYGMDIRGG